MVTPLCGMQQTPIDSLLATDACMTGIGGVCGNQYFTISIPESVKNIPGINIAHFELLAIYVALCSWIKKFTGVKFVISCDNKAVVEVINKGRAKNQLLNVALRKVMFMVAGNQCEIVLRYINTKKNVLPDLLSRWDNPAARSQFQETTKGELQQIHVDDKCIHECYDSDFSGWMGDRTSS